MIPVILSGGSGARLWPLSRETYPKQFLALHSEKTLIQEVLTLLSKLKLLDPIIVCNKEHRFTVVENIENINSTAQHIILEPARRNTAPAIAAAALIAMQDHDDPVLLVLPADHVIEDIQSLSNSIQIAEGLAEKGHMVTFGVQPTEPHTGYGYIEKGAELNKKANKIASFKEKPDKNTANDFIKSGDYLWNSGIFCFKASSYLKELEAHQPDLLKHIKNAVENKKEYFGFDLLEEESFAKCENISIDYAVMEHTQTGVVVTLDSPWSDIGSWDSVWKVSKKDENNNVCRGDIITKDSQNNYIYSQDKLVTTLGVEDLVIINTQDALLIAKKDQAQNVKDIVETLKAQERSEIKHHRTEYRPWGHYDSICRGKRDQVKRISVKPGAKLSLQKHHHRSEHWVVVNGTAKVTKGEETIILTENESIYIPLGVVHALENPGKITLEIIEIQTGSYLGEDDIVRLDDKYGRT